MTACVITAVALLGVYAILQQAMAVEGRASASWSAREAAEAVVDHMAQSLEQAANDNDDRAIVGEPAGGEGGYSMTCVVGPPGYSTNPGPWLGLEHRRYCWGAAVKDGKAGSVTLQTLHYAGARCISPAPNVEGLSETEIWNQVEPKIIATGIGSITVGYRKIGDSSGGWSSRWSGPAGNVAVSISVTAGGQTVERIVVPPANAKTQAGGA
jgi:hypothetical protein